MCRSLEVAVDGRDCFFKGNDLSHVEAFETFVWLLHSRRLLTCKAGSVAWLRRSPAPSLFQRRRPIAVCVLYSPGFSLSQPRRPIAVCWHSLNAHARCSVLSGLGRQAPPCLCPCHARCCASGLACAVGLLPPPFCVFCPVCGSLFF